MKKKIVICVLILVIVVIGMVSLWPLSFSGIIADDADLIVVRTDAEIEDDAPKHTVTNYQFQPDTTEFAQIKQILNNYSFHRSLRTFFDDASIDGNDARYWLHIYSGENNITCGGTGEIIVNSHVYRIGYWGNKTALSMMEEISDLLTD